ncbi:MAG TPA: HAD-IA family hydrolase [Acetobacteraceae bacterium]|nr:HAD-IA family hydrolase [Acetobacteraceae bacterium]
MVEHHIAAPMPVANPGRLQAVIFDVDGVIVDSPHERAWREALAGFADPSRFTTTFYQEHVAGKPRLDGARAALEQLGVADAARQAQLYADRKQKMIEELIRAHAFTAYPDAVRMITAARAAGLRLAVASSSKNANDMLRLIPDQSGRKLIDVFDANVCGRELRHGKPDPEIFLLAAAELRIAPEACVVVEDAPAGIQAAKAGAMIGLGIARHQDRSLLEAAGADLVVTSLDRVDVDALGRGTLRSRPA